MSSNFTLFSALPPELRIRIWQCALSEPAVAAVRRNRTDKQVRRQPHELVVFGSLKASTIGRTCYEALKVVEETHVRLQTCLGTCWFNYNASIIYLGPLWWPFPAESLWSNLHKATLPHIKHVVILYTQFGHLSRVCMKLAEEFSGLESIIIDMEFFPLEIEYEFMPAKLCQLSCQNQLDLEMASFYAGMVSSPEPELSGFTQCLEWDELPVLLAEHFPKSCPSFYFVSSKDRHPQGAKGMHKAQNQPFTEAADISEVTNPAVQSTARLASGHPFEKS